MIRRPVLSNGGEIVIEHVACAYVTMFLNTSSHLAYTIPLQDRCHLHFAGKKLKLLKDKHLSIILELVTDIFQISWTTKTADLLNLNV
jgi:hypothetical protein